MVEKLSENVTKWVGSPTSIAVHTLVFMVAIGLIFLKPAWLNQILLSLTTAVSLEAIYLALFIQMTVNRHEKDLEDLEEDVDDILEDTEELTEEEGAG